MENLDKSYASGDFKSCETLSEGLVQKCTEFTKIKLIYVESLIYNTKVNEALNYLSSKVNESEKQSNIMFNYFMGLAFYYDGKYENAKKLVRFLLNNDKNEPKFQKLNEILHIIEPAKEKGRS